MAAGQEAAAGGGGGKGGATMEAESLQLREGLQEYAYARIPKARDRARERPGMACYHSSLWTMRGGEEREDSPGVR